MAFLQMNILSLKLGTQANFSVILPSYVPSKENANKTYDEIYPKNRRLKTLWLLSTEYGDDQELLNYTAVLRYAQENNLAVVLPCGYNKLYSNEPKGQKFLEFITDELWTVCTGTFALSMEKEDNFIGGVGLGAYAALKAAIKNPDKYSKVLMLGGAFGEDMKNTYLPDLNKTIIANGFPQHLPLDEALDEDYEMVDDAKALIENNNAPKVSLSYIKEDELASYAVKAYENLKALGFDVKVKEYEDIGLYECCDDVFKAEFKSFLCGKE